MANKLKKRGSTLRIMRKIHIKTTMSEVTPHTGQNGYNKKTQILNVGEWVEKKECSCTVWRNINWYNHYGKQYGGSLKKKKKNRVTIWSRNPTPGCVSKKLKILFQKHIWTTMTLCDPMDYMVHGILQAGILEWVAIIFFRGPSHPRYWNQFSHIAGEFFTSQATSKAQYS